MAEDATRVAVLLDPPPRVEGPRHIPPRDPFLLVANHFQTPGIWIGWVAAAITAAVAAARDSGGRNLHWVVTSEWRWFELGGHWVPNPVTSLLFPRASQVWRMIAMPARPTDVAGRARALRQVLAYLGLRPRSEAAPEPVGLFPEGRATVALEEALPGTGAFLHRVSRLGVPILPVGVYQEDGVLVIRFGETFFVGEPPPAEDLDGWVRRQVMAAIGRLLPRDLWGAYTAAISRDD